MSIEIWLAYVVTLTVYMSTPGPSHLLMLTNSMVHGFRPSLATAAGDLCANALQLLAAGMGLTALILASQNALTVIKWVGAAYLLWLGFRMYLRAGKGSLVSSRDGKAHLKTLWLQGFMTSAVNPKAVVFFAALLPQFIEAEGNFGLQFFILAITYIIVDGSFLTAYGAGAYWVSKRLKDQATIWIGRLGGLFMIGAAILLSLKTLSE